MNRRRFLKVVGMGLVGLVVAPLLPRAEEAPIVKEGHYITPWYDSRTGREVLKLPAQPKRELGGTVRALCEYEGNLYAGVDNQLYLYKDEGWEVTKEFDGNIVSLMGIDHLWVATESEIVAL